MVPVICSNNPEALRDALKGLPSATVEAEYGDEVVEGSVVTLAHHGPRADWLCPCLQENKALDIEIIGVSHFDLDTLGGLLAIQGLKPEDPKFWKLAAWADLNGIHNLGGAGSTRKAKEAFYAWWAWSESHTLSIPKDGSVLDITAYAKMMAWTLSRILAGNESLLEGGRQWLKEQVVLEEESFVSMVHIGYGRVAFLRKSPKFVRHLYCHGKHRADAMVSFNERTKSISVSTRKSGVLHAGKLLKELFGEKAGGHKGVGGTPRGTRYTLTDARQVLEVIARKLSPPFYVHSYEQKVPTDRATRQ